MISLYHWHTEPFLIGSLLALGWVYALMVGPLRTRMFGPWPLPRKEIGCFSAGVVMFYLSVGSPLDALGESFLFSAHMVQHNLLMYVCPPLLLLGLPTWMVDTALRNRPGLEQLTYRLTRPVTAGVIVTLTFSLWHLPSLYEAALRVKWIHITEHLTLFFPCLLMWWAFCSPSKRVPSLSPGSQLIYLFALMVAQLPLFAALTFHGGVLYPTYAYAPRLLGLSAAEDQILGGLIMKIANMLVSLALMASVFYRWDRASRQPETENTRREPVTA